MPRREGAPPSPCRQRDGLVKLRLVDLSTLEDPYAIVAGVDDLLAELVCHAGLGRFRLCPVCAAANEVLHAWRWEAFLTEPTPRLERAFEHRFCASGSWPAGYLAREWDIAASR